MNKFLNLTDAQRKIVFEQTALKINLTAEAVEKDFWVSEILNILFTLPYADKMVFKGGTSLSKVWGLISRFSEDIDIAIDRKLFGVEGDITKRQLKKLRKASSVFIRNTLAPDLTAAADKAGISEFVTITPDPDGEGDSTYPEPRKVHVAYRSVLPTVANSYLLNEVVLEVGARSLSEPSSPAKIDSFISSVFPHLTSRDNDTVVATAVAEKTFLEKVFLLHELFSTDGCRVAKRKSRHLYDLYKMAEHGIDRKALADNALWESIRRHREIFTSVRDVDYTPDVRKRLCLTPPEDIIQEWNNDYNYMAAHMIYGDNVPLFSEILESVRSLEMRFRNL